MQLLETIRFSKGILQNLFYHEQRLLNSRKELFGQTDRWDLDELITVPEGLDASKTYRCRVLYSATGIELVEFIPYQIRPIATLQLVDAPELSYAHKYADRTALTSYLKDDTDEVILVKNGLLTDTTYTNIALSDGQEWYTPHQPLLAGTRRAALLGRGIIIPERLSVDDLPYFREIRLFNAMMEWNEAPTLPIAAIRT